MNEPRLSMPHAPYPPPAPSHQQQRSRFVAGMSGSSGGSGSGGSSRGNSRHQYHGHHQPRLDAASSSGGGGGSSSSSLHNDVSSSNQRSGGGGGGGRNKQQLPSRIAFVPGAPCSDLYGAVNCSPVGLATAAVGNTTVDGSARESGGGGGGAASRLKYGPPLLEIRRMKCSLYLPNGSGSNYYGANGGALLNENSEDSGHININDEAGACETTYSSRRQSLFQHETILVSRGIPGLGNNVSSTCLDFRPAASSSSSQTSTSTSTVKCATGLTSGALCIHTLSNLFGTEDAPLSTVAHYAPRQQRPAKSVAWRPGGGSSNGTSNLVAIGLVGSGSTGGGTGGNLSGGSGNTGNIGGSSSKSTLGSMGGITSASVSSLVGSGSGGGMGVGVGGASSAGMIGLGNAAVGLGDRDFGALVWDIEAQSSVTSGAGTVGGKKKGSASVGGVGKAGTAAVPIKTPAYRYAHNSGVETLSWLSDGRILAVGCQKRNVQLYDLRVSGTNSPPISVFAHTEAVAGIAPDVNCATGTVFATFGRNVGEPVKIWDARMMDSTLGEIVVPHHSTSRDGRGGISSSASSGGGGVSAIAWPMTRPGVLSIAVGDSIRNYDTRSPGSRALPVGVSYLDNATGGEYGDGLPGEDGNLFVQCLTFQPQRFDVHSSCRSSETNPFEIYPHRTIVATSQGQIRVIPECHAAPLAISKRDGRISTSLGGTVWIGPSAMEGQSILTEDISARMMRRARCFHASKYSTDARDNVRMLEEEKVQILAHEHLHLSSQKSEQPAKSSQQFIDVIFNINQLLHCWRWIARVEHLSLEQQRGNSTESEMVFHSDDITSWPAKGLIDAGVLKLLRMSSRDIPDESNNWMDIKSTSDTLFCDVFDSPMRRAALNACGWLKKYGILQDLIEECEGRGEFERSAALAVWHGDLSSCVSALQRGAEDVKTLVVEEDCNLGDGPPASSKSSVARETRSALGNNFESYSETLSLIAMCVAGFNVTTMSDGTMKTTNLWSNACDNLLRRPDISTGVDSGVSYLRAILLFLQNIGSEAGFDKTIYNEGLSLADRVGFACRFLPRNELYSFLEKTMRKCIKLGHLEGLLITGLDKRGIGLLQSYMDRNSDVQTAALISCRVVVPMEWSFERRSCLEWLESYRLLLNGLQMWNSRAAFDVGRFEHLRRLKQGIPTLSSSGRHFAAKKQHQKDKALANNNFPPQLWARCNYCNASLPLSKLRRSEGIANSWLSRQKPVLTCCPQCKKPLPRCSICLLSLGCLNPYMELQRERNQYPRSGMSMLGGGAGGNIQGMEDLSGLASIPFATWFSWCMRCKHGGHAHHLCGWFEKHDTCAVSGCDCRCQFDGIEKLSRPGLQ